MSDKKPYMNDLNLEVSLEKKNSPFNLFTKWKISEKLKKAFKEEIELRDGLRIALNEYNLKKHIKIDFSIDIAPLEFAYCISGEAKSVIKHTDFEEEITLKKGMFAIFYFPETKGYIELGGNEKVKILTLHISPDYLKNFIADEMMNLPAQLTGLIYKKTNNPFIISGDMTPSMMVNSKQIFDTKLKGIAKNMLYEAKALELMTLILSELSENTKDYQISLTDYEMQQINLVKDKLSHNFANPPSLNELTQIAGMTANKLNNVFKMLYNTTVFGYLRNLRLEYSKMLLTENKLSITEITYEAGWSNPSHFSKEFTKHYSVSPKQFKNDQLKIQNQSF